MSSQPKESQRIEVLQRQQRLKMARSARAYVRGSTVKLYEWLKSAKGKVPEGPSIWICGDCHLDKSRWALSHWNCFTVAIFAQLPR